MKKKTNKLKYMAGAFLAGALLFTGILFGAGNPEGTLGAIKHTMSKISYYVNGKDNSTADGPFAQQGRRPRIPRLLPAARCTRSYGFGSG